MVLHEGYRVQRPRELNNNPFHEHPFAIGALPSILVFQNGPTPSMNRS
jgi:hypothetical protein